MATIMALLLCCEPGIASAEEAEEQQAEVRRLVRQLDDDRPAVRQAAEARLLELGPSVLPLLPRPTAQLSPEVRRRLARVATELQAAAAEQAVRGTRVQLRGELPPAAVLAAIEQQTGNQFAPVAGLDRLPEISVDFPDVPFWEAVDRTLEKTGMTIDLYGGQAQALSVVPAVEGQVRRVGRADYRGPFRFEATRITAVRDLRQPARSGMRLRLEVLWEPKLNPIAMSLAMSEVAATDDRGEPIAVSNAGAVLETAGNPLMPGVELELPFEPPSRDARQIRTMTGSLTTLLPGRRERFEFGNLAEATGKRLQRAGVTVTFEQLRKNEDVYEAWIRLAFEDAAGAFESHRGWFYQNSAYVVDQQGKRMKHEQLEQTGRGDSEVRLTYLFVLEQDPRQYTFEYETPVLILSREIPFALKEIPLP